MLLDEDVEGAGHLDDLWAERDILINIDQYLSILININQF